MPYILWHWLLYVQDGFALSGLFAGITMDYLIFYIFYNARTGGLLKFKVNTTLKDSIRNFPHCPKQIYRNDFHLTNQSHFAHTIDFNFRNVLTDVPVIAVTFRRLIPFFNKANSFAYCSLYDVSVFL